MTRPPEPGLIMKSEGAILTMCGWPRGSSKLLGMMSEGIGESVPYACQDWANTKAAYRFFSNDEVSEDQIMAGHFQATRGRLSQANQKILMLHDTCEFSFQRDKDSKIGLLGRPACGKGQGWTH